MLYTYCNYSKSCLGKELFYSAIWLEYVRYGIEMQKGTQKALRNQQKTIAKRKKII